MKPKNIFLIRHGESEGNVDKNIHTSKPDYAYKLTEKGKVQAGLAAYQLIYRCKDRPLQFYYSPFWRTRETFLQIATRVNVFKAFEDPRLREQEWGTSFEEQREGLDKMRDGYGHFYFRIPNGESCADVYDRVSDFCNTLWRDFEKEDFPRNCALILHGMTMRVFIMRWFHLTVEEFEKLANTENCGIVHLCLNELTGKYELVGKLKEYETYNHPFQFSRLKELDEYKKPANLR